MRRGSISAGGAAREGGKCGVGNGAVSFACSTSGNASGASCSSGHVTGQNVGGCGVVPQGDFSWGGQQWDELAGARSL